MRDLTKTQYERAMEREGFQRDFFGYWQLPNSATLIYPGNAGPSRRAQLAYALREARRHEARAVKTEGTKS